MIKETAEWRSKSGMTILEVLIVLAIIAMVAAVAGPRLTGYLDRAKSETAQLQIDQLSNALQLFYIDTGRYPTEAEGLNVLISAPPGDASWSGPYLDDKSGFTDPWARTYLYEETSIDERPNIISFGRDGKRGGTGIDADISSN